MNECRMCGELTDSESLLCDVCRTDLKAAAVESGERFDKGALSVQDSEAGLSYMIVAGGPAQQAALVSDAPLRCLTCGRMDHCCCGPDCAFCPGGAARKHGMKWIR